MRLLLIVIALTTLGTSTVYIISNNGLLAGMVGFSIFVGSTVIGIIIRNIKREKLMDKIPDELDDFFGPDAQAIQKNLTDTPKTIKGKEKAPATDTKVSNASVILASNTSANESVILSNDTTTNAELKNCTTETSHQNTPARRKNKSRKKKKKK